MSTTVSPLAGKPALKELLVDLVRLQRGYYQRRPDLAELSKRVRDIDVNVLPTSISCCESSGTLESRPSILAGPPPMASWSWSYPFRSFRCMNR